MNHVQNGSFLTLHYRLSGPDGTELINTFGHKPATLSIGGGELAPAIEARLLGLTEGTRRSFELEPGEAFGPRNGDLLQRVKRSLLDQLGDPAAHYAVGDVIQFPSPSGEGAYAGTVRELDGDVIVFDFNHPLAGRPVTFEVELIGVL